MLPDRVSNPGTLTYESDALPIALHDPAVLSVDYQWATKHKSGKGNNSDKKTQASYQIQIY